MTPKNGKSTILAPGLHWAICYSWYIATLETLTKNTESPHAHCPYSVSASLAIAVVALIGDLTSIKHKR